LVKYVIVVKYKFHMLKRLEYITIIKMWTIYNDKIEVVSFVIRFNRKLATDIKVISVVSFISCCLSVLSLLTFILILLITTVSMWLLLHMNCTWSLHLYLNIFVYTVKVCFKAINCILDVQLIFINYNTNGFLYITIYVRNSLQFK
jgi:hypothetical protein